MKINYADIKLEFFKFLAEQSKVDIDLSKLDDVSIFSFSDDFKDFVSDQYGLDNSIFSLDLNEILSYSFSDGKMVDDTPEDGNQFALDYLNDLISDDGVKEVIDTNKDGVITDEEVENFFTKVAELDGNAADVSASDVKNVFAQIESGSFKLEAPKTERPKSPSGPSGPSGPSSSTGPTTPTTPTNPTDPGTSGDETNEVNLTGMTVEQLNSEKATAQGERDEQFELLNQINKGEGPVAAEKKAMDDAFTTMQTELEKLDADLAKEFSEAKADREGKEQAVNENETAIAQKTAEKADAQADLDNANSNIASIQSCIDGLNSQMSSAETDEEKAIIQGKIDEANSKLQQAEAEKQRAQDALSQATSALEELTSKSSELKSALEAAKTRENTAEEQVNALANKEGNEAFKALKDAYDTAKTNYETAKTTAANAAKDIIKAKQEYIGKINAQIPETQKAENEKNLKANTTVEQDIEDKVAAVGGNAKDLKTEKLSDGTYLVTETTLDGVEVKYTFDAEGNMTSYQDGIGTFKADGDKVVLTNDNKMLKKWQRGAESCTIDASLEDVVSQLRQSNPRAESFINAALNSFPQSGCKGVPNSCVKYTDFVFAQLGEELEKSTKDIKANHEQVSYDDVKTGDIYNDNLHIGMVLLHIKDRNGKNIFLTADSNKNGVWINVRDENDSPDTNKNKKSIIDGTMFYRGLR